MQVFKQKKKRNYKERMLIQKRVFDLVSKGLGEKLVAPDVVNIVKDKKIIYGIESWLKRADKEEIYLDYDTGAFLRKGLNEEVSKNFLVYTNKFPKKPINVIITHPIFSINFFDKEKILSNLEKELIAEIITKPGRENYNVLKVIKEYNLILTIKTGLGTNNVGYFDFYPPHKILKNIKSP